MNNQVINIKRYNDVASLKLQILQELKLVDHKKDSLGEFDNRLKSYLDRNKSLGIVLQFNRDSLEKDLKFRASLSNSPQPYPENYEMGNPHNRWFWDPSPTKGKENDNLEKAFQNNLTLLHDFLDSLQRLASEQITINYR